MTMPNNKKEILIIL